MVNAFHRQLTLGFLRNLIRTLLALLVALGSYHALTLGSFSPGYREFFLAILKPVLPMSLLVASLFTVGAVARHNELTALKAAGWPLHRIMGPVLLMGLVSVPVSALLFTPGLLSNPLVEADAATRTALHADRSWPLVNMLAVVLGISFGSTRRPRTMFSGFFLGALSLVGFFVASATAQALGRHGILHPMMAGWLPILLFTGLAWVLWVRNSA